LPTLRFTTGISNSGANPCLTHYATATTAFDQQMKTACCFKSNSNQQTAANTTDHRNQISDGYNPEM
jgi:hypothetical protein